jgi:hypothetical protein
MYCRQSPHLDATTLNQSPRNFIDVDHVELDAGANKKGDDMGK